MSLTGLTLAFLGYLHQVSLGYAFTWTDLVTKSVSHEHLILLVLIFL